MLKLKVYVAKVRSELLDNEILVGVWTSIEEAKSRLDQFVGAELIDVDSTEDLYRREYMDGTIGLIDVVPLNKFAWEAK